MENRRNWLIVTGITFLVLFVYISTVFYFNQASKKVLTLSSTELTPLNTFSSPVTLYLDGSMIHFHCMDTIACFSDIDLGEPIKTLNDPHQHPLSLQFAYYGLDSTIYLNIAGSIWDYLVKINPQTKQIQFLDINIPSLSSKPDVLPITPMFLPGGIKIIHNKIVVATADGKIGILQDDFSLEIIDLKEPIRDFIEANDSKIIFLSQLGNDKRQGKVFLVDVNSSMIEEKTFNVPQDAQVVTVDNSLHYLYWLSFADKTLHLFDIQSQKDVLSAPISDGDVYAYTTLTTPIYQYHGILYSGGVCPCEGPLFPSMLDMSTLKPVVNPQELLKNEDGSIGTFIIAPFGDNFLIGMTSHVLVVSPSGTVIKMYDLPKELVGRNYSLLEYRN